MTLPVPSHVGHGVPLFCPVPLQSGHTASPVPVLPGSASSPGAGWEGVGSLVFIAASVFTFVSGDQQGAEIMPPDAGSTVGTALACTSAICEKNQERAPWTTTIFLTHAAR